MNHADIDRIPKGYSMDLLIHLKIMGYVNDRSQFPETHTIEWLRDSTPYYSTDIAAAWLILSRFFDFRIESEGQVYGEWTINLWKLVNNDEFQMGQAIVKQFDEIPLAICRAALKTVR